LRGRADKGDLAALCHLGLKYRVGLGVTKDAAEAVR
jgi:hypothetical protein